ncbi:LamG-like jellyroll fold domain-containing protein [Rubritalea tangerina]
MKQGNRDEEAMYDMILAAKNGELSDVEMEALHSAMMESEEVRKMYLRINQIDELIGGAIELEGGEKVARVYRWPSLVAVAGMAAAVAIFVTVWMVGEPEDDSGIVGEERKAPIASLKSDYGAFFEGMNGGIQEFNAGEFHLEKGIASLIFANGAEVVFQESSQFKIEDDMRIVLKSGKVWAHCPPSAQGFTIDLPGQNSVVDLGTEFGVEVVSERDSVVQVFSGIVELHSAAHRPYELSQGQAVVWRDGGEPVEIDFETVNFVSSEQLEAQRFEAYKETVLGKHGLIYYSDFQIGEAGKVYNEKNGASGVKRMENVWSASGRFGDTRAVQFAHKGSVMELDVPEAGELDELTVVAWVKPEKLVKSYSAIMNTHGWRSGGMHLQVTGSGELAVGVYPGHAYRSKGGTISVDRWQMIAVTVNVKTETVTAYLDGDLLDMRRLRKKESGITRGVDLGMASLGGWQNLDYRDYVGPRNLNGAIDEMVIFDRELGAEEVREMYALGQP